MWKEAGALSRAVLRGSNLQDFTKPYSCRYLHAISQRQARGKVPIAALTGQSAILSPRCPRLPRLAILSRLTFLSSASCASRQAETPQSTTRATVPSTPLHPSGPQTGNHGRVSGGFGFSFWASSLGRHLPWISIAESTWCRWVRRRRRWS